MCCTSAALVALCSATGSSSRSDGALRGRRARVPRQRRRGAASSLQDLGAPDRRHDKLATGIGGLVDGRVPRVSGVRRSAGRSGRRSCIARRRLTKGWGVGKRGVVSSVSFERVRGSNIGSHSSASPMSLNTTHSSRSRATSPMVSQEVTALVDASKGILVDEKLDIPPTRPLFSCNSRHVCCDAKV